MARRHLGGRAALRLRMWIWGVGHEWKHITGVLLPFLQISAAARLKRTWPYQHLLLFSNLPVCKALLLSLAKGGHAATGTTKACKIIACWTVFRASGLLFCQLWGPGKGHCHSCRVGGAGEVPAKSKEKDSAQVLIQLRLK